MLIGGITSASREACARSSTAPTSSYFYTNQYEGGVCDASMISIGAVPEQQFSTLIPWMMEKFGKKVYTIAADYNFGQISAEWTRDLVKKQGGEVVGEEFIPLGVSQFSQTIQNIQKAKPDWLMTLNVGAAQDSFFEQAAAAKLNLPMAQLDQGHAGLRAQALPAAGLQNMHAAANWFEEIDTPAAQGLQEALARQVPERALHQRHGLQRLRRDLHVQDAGRERRSRPSKADLRKVIATGNACIDAPEGKICIDPKSQHTSHHMRMIGGQRRPLGAGDQGFRRHQALLARRGRLRPDQERSEGAVHAVEPADEELTPRSRAAVEARLDPSLVRQ